MFLTIPILSLGILQGCSTPGPDAAAMPMSDELQVHFATRPGQANRFRQDSIARNSVAMALSRHCRSTRSPQGTTAILVEFNDA